MKPTLTQIQEEFDEKFPRLLDININVYGDDRITSRNIKTKEVKFFLEKSNLRVLEKVKEMVEKREVEVQYDNPILEAQCTAYNQAVHDIKSDLSILIEQK